VHVTTYLLGPAAVEVASVVPGATVFSAEARSDWVAALAATLYDMVRTGRVTGPYYVIGQGDDVNDVPALAFALRAARRPASGYLFIEPRLTADRRWVDWPDAPVTVVTASPDAERAARLRGWQVAVGTWRDCLPGCLPDCPPGPAPVS